MTEPVKIICPLPEYGQKNDDGQWESEYFISRPAVWLGRHSLRRDEAVEKADGKLGSGDLLRFAVSMALAEDWKLPGMNGNPEKWDFEQLDLRVITWVNRVIYGDFSKVYEVPKNW